MKNAKPIQCVECDEEVVPEDEDEWGAIYPLVCPNCQCEDYCLASTDDREDFHSDI